MNIQKMMKQRRKCSRKMTDLQSKLEEEETDGSSGGGMVVVRLNGKGALKKITIDPKLMDPSEKEMLEDLIVAAFNDTKNKVEAAVGEKMSKITSGMGLPPGLKLPF